MEAYVTHTHAHTHTQFRVGRGGVRRGGGGGGGGDDNAHSTLRKTLMLCTSRSRCSTPMTLVLYMILYDYMILHIC